ncbi:riboflavin synthase subunit alpha [Lonsdalea quercina]|uniref:riboflavin synthase subunit alpha n=1 Tax=Lonsdalea quercina TaxID=71657 RepID=UPI0039770FB9
MYTGIVQGTERIIDIIVRNGYKTVYVSNILHLFDDVFIGASVSLDGTCLTLTSFEKNIATFDISDATSDLTTLKNIKVGDLVNIERSHITGRENGGHSLYGHVAGVARVKDSFKKGETIQLEVELPSEDLKYFFQKGFIGLHGCSLTVNGVNLKTNTIELNLIPETIRLTNFGQIKIGSLLNYEIDQMTRTIVDTISSTIKSINL